mmetsp:Transcript_80967/g.211040  ORF Transcript_80967/g.211040 Transcript_80967/m.211040 type:complete len:243 (+) Transcript_80967:539-1267(+)
MAFNSATSNRSGSSGSCTVTPANRISSRKPASPTTYAVDVCRATSSAATLPDVTTSSAPIGAPNNPPMRAATSARLFAEALVTKARRVPAAFSFRTASALPGIGSLPRQSTPSQSNTKHPKSSASAPRRATESEAAEACRRPWLQPLRRPPPRRAKQRAPAPSAAAAAAAERSLPGSSWKAHNTRPGTLLGRGTAARNGAAGKLPMQVEGQEEKHLLVTLVLVGTTSGNMANVGTTMDGDAC